MKMGKKDPRASMSKSVKGNRPSTRPAETLSSRPDRMKCQEWESLAHRKDRASRKPSPTAIRWQMRIAANPWINGLKDALQLEYLPPRLAGGFRRLEERRAARALPLWQRRAERRLGVREAEGEAGIELRADVPNLQENGGAEVRQDRSEVYLELDSGFRRNDGNHWTLNTAM